MEAFFMIIAIFAEWGRCWRDVTGWC